MKNKANIHLCFIREKEDHFNHIIDQLLQKLFQQTDFSWKLYEKEITDGELIIAELTGTSLWKQESDIVAFLEKNAEEPFWQYLQGYHLQLEPIVKGCVTCGTS